mmetsp:Transcript_15465/g.36567  ORF Transcript_15465/g.36567 Transcript_15465/m.36567 type:complete len:204 (-) Transcript_15465:2643-3254(-)
MQKARKADATEKTAPIFAWLRRPISTNASFETKSATVRPTPPNADMANKSTTVSPTGRRKPITWASRAKNTIPKVFPTMSAMTVAIVRVPTEFSFTPALHTPKKNIPKSTPSLRWCSKACRGAPCRARNSCAALRRISLLTLGMRTPMASTFDLASDSSSSLRWAFAWWWVAGINGTTPTSAKAGCTCAIIRPNQEMGPARKT